MTPDEAVIPTTSTTPLTSTTNTIGNLAHTSTVVNPTVGTSTAMTVTVDVEPLHVFVAGLEARRTLGEDFECWVKNSLLARSYYDTGTRHIHVLAGNETDERLLAHEYGHLKGLEHPGEPGGKWKQTWAAIIAWGPIMAWTEFLRWRDPQGLIADWRSVPKTWNNPPSPAMFPTPQVESKQ